MKFTAFPAAALLAAAAAPALAQTEVKVAYALATESHYGAGALAWQEVVEAETDGRYSFTHFPSSALGGERDVVEGVQIGTIEAALVSSGTLANFVPQTGVFDIPFLFRDLEHARTVLDGPIGQEMLARFDDVGLKALAWGEQGFRHITNNRGPIATPDDIAGLRIRTMENPIHLRAFDALGAAPTPMAWPEVIGALQQGTIDGQENPLSVIVSVGLSDVQEHLTLSGHVYSPAILLVSPQLWNSMSEDDQAAFVAGAEAGVAAMRGFVDAIERDGVETLRAQGMEVGALSADQRAAFRDALIDAYAAYGTEFGAELIEAIVTTE